MQATFEDLCELFKLRRSLESQLLAQPVFPHERVKDNEFILFLLLPGICGGVDADLQPLDLLLARLQPIALPVGGLLNPRRSCHGLKIFYQIFLQL